MSQLVRKWIEDGAINASKIDATSTDQTYIMHGLQITTDATIGDGFSVVGTSHLFDMSASRNAKIGNDMTVMGHTLLSNMLHVTGDSTVTGNSSVTGNSRVGGDITCIGNVAIGGSLSVTLAPTFPSLTVNGTSTLRDATLSSGMSVGGDSTFNKGLRIGGSLTASPILGDSTVTGGFKVTNSLTANQIAGDSTITGGLKVTNSLTAPKLVGDSTVSGGLSITNRTTTTSLAAPSIVGDSTVTGGLKVTNSLTANQIAGDSTISGGFKVTNSLTAPTINGSTQVTGGLTTNSLLVIQDATIQGGAQISGANTRLYGTNLVDIGDPVYGGHVALTGSHIDLNTTSRVSVIGDGTFVGGLSVSNSLTAPQINGDTAISGAFNLTGYGYLRGESGIPNILHLQSNGSLICDSSSDAYFQSNSGKASLLAKSADGTVVFNRLVALSNKIELESNVGSILIKADNGNIDMTSIGGHISFGTDATAFGGLSINGRATTASLAAPQIVGDSTIAGSLKVNTNTTLIGNVGIGATAPGGQTTLELTHGAGVMDLLPLSAIFPNKSAISTNTSELDINSDSGSGDIFLNASNIIVGGDTYTDVFQNYTPAISGLSSGFGIDATVSYKRVGNLVSVWFSINGFSDGNNWFYFSLPPDCTANPAQNVYQNPCYAWSDTDSSNLGDGIGLVEVAPDIFPDLAIVSPRPWMFDYDGVSKIAVGSFTYEAQPR